MARTSEEQRIRKSVLRKLRAFPYSGGGRLNYYRLFVETNWNLLRPSRSLGMVVPSGLSVNKYEEPTWHQLLQTGAINAFLDFENVDGVSSARCATRSTKFSLLTATRGISGAIRAGCWLRSVNELADPDRAVIVTVEDLREFDPESLSLPQFRSRRDLTFFEVRFYIKFGRFSEIADWSHTPKADVLFF